MVSRTYVIPKIGPEDRIDHDRQVERAQARGDLEEVQIIVQLFDEWERDQGQERQRLVCAVCESTWLSPTSKGTARPHRRYGLEGPTWDRVRRLRKDLQVLQAELDRVLELLEGQSTNHEDADG